MSSMEIYQAENRERLEITRRIGFKAGVSEEAQPGKLESASFNSAFWSRWPNCPCMLVFPPR